jgi:glycosyltransferase involved in cell wall biosynthesis
VTVVMAVRNEGAFLQKSLGSVLAQDYPADRLEIILADGMSEDGTRAAAEAMRDRHSGLTVIDNPGRVVATGLNAAIRRARGDVVVRVDGHTEIAPDYVRQCVDALERTGADNVGGRMNAVGAGPFGEAVAIATSSPFGVGGARFHYSAEEEWVDTVYLGAWRRDVFERIGLFDEELVRDQDDEFNYRLRAAGGRVLLTPAVKSLYTVRGRPARLWRQYFEYGLWKVRVLQKHPRQMQPRQFVPPAFAASLVALAAGAPFSRVARWGLAGVGGAYAAANLAAAASASRRKPARAPLVSLAFGILHLSYGFGFLTGLLRFAGRWRDPRGASGRSPFTAAAAAPGRMERKS